MTKRVMAIMYKNIVPWSCQAEWRLSGAEHLRAAEWMIYANYIFKIIQCTVVTSWEDEGLTAIYYRDRIYVL